MNCLSRMLISGFLIVLFALLAINPAIAADEEMPAHLTLRIPSKLLSETRVINVYVPPEYDGKAADRYPVLYMLDGGEKEDFSHLSITLDALIKHKTIPPMLLVGIENTERRRDLTGPTTVASDLEIAPVVGESASFREFIEKELKPQIAMFYNVNSHSAIIGESLAGLFVIETLFLKPDLFDTYIAFDPSLWWNAEQWWRESSTRLDGSVDIHARLFFASSADTAISSTHLADALCRNRLPNFHWSFSEHPKLRHDNIFRSLEKETLIQAFSGAPMAESDCSGKE
ncbi:MAG TPA: alpha/beta hydrolase-fold protein [Dokdonella sp.]|uniref:alpha/beta hydrolase n=1 Tax=Dokdonella sp. TaxID=2291710 RepID=UPI002D7FEE21|nr:alpha/beta hydrolase-fold protein [Dokdonella sp.]HET9034139.1 alpha/beta hydrolase-fold protein [Dokdonella sp.]